LSVLERIDLKVLKTASRSAPGAQEYPFASGIGMLGSGVGIAEVDDAVMVLVKIVENEFVEDANVVVVSWVRVVVITCETFALELAIICTGHN
jgi:hypothetical protein